MIRAAIPASISVALLLAGCGKPVPTGTFEGHRNDVGRPGADPVIVAQLNRVILRIDADGKSVLEDGGIPWEGHVTRSGDTLTFDVDAINGVGIAKQPGDLSRHIEFGVVSESELTYGGIKLGRAASR